MSQNTEIAKTGDSVTCSERARMNALAGILFIIGGDGIILVAVMGNVDFSTGSMLTALFGIFGVMLGIYYMFVFMNKRITVSDDGVIYCNWLGKRVHYDWDQVQVSHHPGRNAYFTFDLAGKKVTFYGYAKNAQELHDYLVAHKRYDADTMRAEEKATEQREQQIRALQQKARQNDYDDDDDWDDED